MNKIIGNTMIIAALISTLFLFAGAYIYYKKVSDITIKKRIQLCHGYHIALKSNNDNMIGILQNRTGNSIDNVLNIEYSLIYCYLIGSDRCYIINKITSSISNVDTYKDFPSNILRKFEETEQHDLHI